MLPLAGPAGLGPSPPFAGPAGVRFCAGSARSRGSRLARVGLRPPWLLLGVPHACPFARELLEPRASVRCTIVRRAGVFDGSAGSPPSRGYAGDRRDCQLRRTAPPSRDARSGRCCLLERGTERLHPRLNKQVVARRALSFRTITPPRSLCPAARERDFCDFAPPHRLPVLVLLPPLQQRCLAGRRARVFRWHCTTRAVADAVRTAR